MSVILVSNTTVVVMDAQENARLYEYDDPRALWYIFTAFVYALWVTVPAMINRVINLKVWNSSV